MESRSSEIGRPEVPARAAYRKFGLADCDEMRGQLEGVCGPGPAQARFLESILGQANNRVTGVGLTFFLSQTLTELIESSRETAGDVLRPEQIPSYLDALITDPEIREDTLDLWDDMTQGAKSSTRSS